MNGGALHRAILGSRIALAVLAVSPRAAAVDTLSFRQLNGTSTKLQVKRLFPEAKPYALCQGRVARLAGGIYNCAGLQLDEYVVGGHRLYFPSSGQVYRELRV